MKKYIVVDFDDSVILESFDRSECEQAFLELHPFWDADTLHLFITTIDVFFTESPDSEYNGYLRVWNSRKHVNFVKRFRRWASIEDQKFRSFR